MTSSRPVPAQTALFVVDVQERLAAVMRDTRAIENTGRLIDGARALSMRVLVTEQYPKGLGHTVPQLKEKLADARVIPTGVPPNAADTIVSGPLSRTTPVVIEKLDFDACDDPSVQSELDALRAARVETIVLSGMEAHICVAQTARGLVDRGFRVLVAGDATASRAAENERIAEGLWRAAGALPTSTEAVLFDLVQRASGDAFKAISKLVR